MIICMYPTDGLHSISPLAIEGTPVQYIMYINAPSMTHINDIENADASYENAEASYDNKVPTYC